MEDGIPNPDYKANVREDDDSMLGIVSTKYNLVQHFEEFAFLDELLKSGAKFECAGTL